MAQVYAGFSAPRYESESRASVELLKYVENSLDSVLLSFWNEVLFYAMKVGLDSSDFAKMLSVFPDRPKFASTVRAPGKAFGMWCLPKDLTAIVSEIEKCGALSGTLSGALETNLLVTKVLGEGGESSTALLVHDDRNRVSLTADGYLQLRNAINVLRAEPTNER